MELEYQLNIRLDSVRAKLDRLERDFSDQGVKSGISFGSNFTRQLSVIDIAFGNIAADLFSSLASSAKGFFTDAIKQSADFEQSINRVQALTKANSEEFEQLRNQARQLGAATQFSASEAANAQIFLAQAGFEYQEIIASLPDVLNLAAAGNIELAQSADIASNILGQFNLTADDTARVSNVLAAVQASANTNILQASEAFRFLGPTAQSLNISLEETAAVIGKLGDAGIQGSLAGRALGTSLVNLTKPSSAAAKVMEDLNLALFDQEGQFVGITELVRQLEDATGDLTQEQRAAAISTLFGAESYQELNTLLNVGAEEFENYVKQITDTDEANRLAAKNLEGFNGAIKLLQSAIGALFISFTDLGVLNLFDTTIRGVAQSISEVSRVFDLLQTGDFTNSIFGQGEGSGFIGFLFDIRQGLVEIRDVFNILKTGDFTNSIFGQDEGSNFISFLLNAREAAFDLGAALRVLRDGGDVDSIFGLDNDSEFVNFLRSTNSFLTTLSQRVGSFSDGFGGGLSQIFAIDIGASIGQFASFLGDAIESIRDFVDTTNLVEGATTIFNSFVDFASTGLSSILTFFSTIQPSLTVFISAIGALATTLFVVLKNALVQVLPPVLELFGSIVQLVLPIAQIVLPILLALATFITTVLIAAILIILPIVVRVFTGIVTIITGVVNIVAGILNVLAGLIIGVFTGDFSQAVEGAKLIFVGFVTFLRGLAGTVFAPVLGIVDTIKNTFETLDLLEIGQNIIDGLIAGINSKAEQVKESVANLANQLPQGIRDTLNIQSPSRVLRDLLETGLEAIPIALDSMSNPVREATQSLSASIVDNLSIPPVLSPALISTDFQPQNGKTVNNTNNSRNTTINNFGNSFNEFDF
jgi:TP901 family phage tail tape measure protein